MRITREFILKFVQETVERRNRAGRDLQAAFLCGSFLSEDYLIGGAGDVDLVLVHNDSPALQREIVRLTDDLHLDISHQDQRDYRDTRRLRIDPWIGPALNTCKIIHDPQHFLDFVQASVRGQFERSDHIYSRARPQMDRARERWFALADIPKGEDIHFVQEYLSAVGGAANAVASLSGPPLTERRLLLEFENRAQAIEFPGLYAGLLGLLGAPNLDQDKLSAWLPEWEQAFDAAQEEGAPVRLTNHRQSYYRNAFYALAESGHPASILWLLLTTWTDLAAVLPEESPRRESWQQALEHLGLVGKTRKQRIAALDAYLDLVEETLENWARKNGAWENI